MNEIPALVSAEHLVALTGFTDRWLRDLAKRGYYSPPEHGQYAFVQTVKGLIRYFREQAEKSREDIEVARKQKLDKENILLQLKIDEAERRLVPLASVETAWEFVIVELRQGIQSAPLSDTEKRILLDRLQKIPIDDYFRKSNPADDAADGATSANAAAA
mgnify:CR=1 FL=1